MTRTFIALDLSAAARETVARQARRLERALPGLRSVDPATLHLTLAFLGELDEAAIGAATEVTETAARETAPVTLTLGRLGVFGAPDAPRVIWLGLADDMARLYALQRRLAQALAARGFPPEVRRYSPHLTLARPKGRLDAEAARRLRDLLAEPALPLAPDAPPWRVTEAQVMRSDLTRAGARYTPLRVIPLRGAETDARPEGVE